LGAAVPPKGTGSTLLEQVQTKLVVRVGGNCAATFIPNIEAIAPTKGSLNGTVLALTGTGFEPNLHVVLIGGHPCEQNDREVVCEVPPLPNVA
jgi:hypothetical protein